MRDAGWTEWYILVHLSTAWNDIPSSCHALRLMEGYVGICWQKTCACLKMRYHLLSCLFYTHGTTLPLEKVDIPHFQTTTHIILSGPTSGPLVYSTCLQINRRCTILQFFTISASEVFMIHSATGVNWINQFFVGFRFVPSCKIIRLPLTLACKNDTNIRGTTLNLINI